MPNKKSRGKRIVPRKNVEMNAALLEGARAVLESRNFAEAAKRIFKVCKKLTGAAAGYVALLSADKTRNEIVYLDVGDYSCAVPHDAPMPIRGFRQKVYQSGKTLYENNFSQTNYNRLLPKGHTPLKNVLFAPLKLKGEAVGLLGLGNKPGGFNDDDARMVSAFAELAAIALMNSRAQEHLEELVQGRTAEIRSVNKELRAEIETRARAEEELLTANKIMSSIFETTHFNVALFDRNFNFLYVNRSYAEQCAMPAQKMIGKNFFKLFPAPEVEKLYRKVLRAGKPYSLSAMPYDFPNQPERGTTYWDWTLHPLFGPAGKVDRLLITSVEVTEQKKAELKIKKMNSLLAAVKDINVALLAAADESALYQRICDACLRAPFLKFSWIGLVEPGNYNVRPVAAAGFEDGYLSSIKVRWDDSPFGRGPTGTCIKTRKTFLMSEMDSDPRYRPWKAEAAKRGYRASLSLPLIHKRETLGALMVYADDPEAFEPEAVELLEEVGREIAIGIKSLRAEKELKQAASHWKATFDAIGDHICLLDRDGTVLQCNEGMAALLNLPQDKIVGQKCHQLMHHSDRFFHGCPYLKMIKSGKRESFELASGDNYFQVSADPVLDDQGVIIGAVHIMRDITERRRDQDALAREKELLAVTLRSIGDGVIATDTRGTIFLFNRAAEELTGWRLEDAQGQPLERVLPLKDRKTGAGNPVEESVRNGVIIGSAGNVSLLTKNRGERSISYSSAPILDRSSKIIGAVVAFSDITDQERMEQELLKTEKLESLGVLAGGIAHDFNNILTAILGNISLVKMNFAQETEEFVDLSDAETACHRARDLARQLLTFSKGDAPLTRPTAIAGLIKESAAFILAGAKARLELALPEQLWPVEADAGQISQVIHNLVLNADQAMPGGGTIKVSAENILVEQHEQLLMQPGKYVRISVSDHGVGIPEQNLKKIFDPFFTTKEKGNGLGLSVVYSIVKKHRGHLEVKSEVGAGSTFLVCLPASEKDASGKERDAQLIVGKGLVLVMDDEEKVRQVAGRMLWKLGYETVFARDGVEAIQLYQQSQESGHGFDAVIMDLTIPGGMGGKEAVKKILELDPQARVIASSGYFTDPVMTDHQQYGFLDRIAKPYAIKEMSQVLARVLKKS